MKNGAYLQLPVVRMLYRSLWKNRFVGNMLVIGKRRSDKDCLYPHNSKETMRHWIVKAMVFKILHDRGCTVRTEAEVKGCIVDVVDEGNLIAYEIETSMNEEKSKRRVQQLWHMHDMFFVDCKKVPDGFVEAVEYLKEIIG